MGFGRLAPVDQAGGIAARVGTELPKGLADTGAPAPMHALGHGCRDMFSFDHQPRQACAERFRIEPERVDLGEFCEFRRHIRKAGR